MRGVNKVILVGSLGRDPEVRFAANGTAIANLSVATGEQWNDKATGEKQEKTEWHRVVIFGKLAQIAQEFLTKGSQVYLEGKLQTRKWQDQTSGQDRYSTEVVLDFNGVMQILGGGGNQNQQQGGHAPQGNNMNQQAGYNQASAYQAPANQQARPPANNQAQAGYNPNQPPQYAPNDFDDMNVPF